MYGMNSMNSLCKEDGLGVFSKTIPLLHFFRTGKRKGLSLYYNVVAYSCSFIMEFYLLVCLFVNWCTWGFLELLMSGINPCIHSVWDQTGWVADCWKGSGEWIQHWRWANSKFSLQLGKLSYLWLEDSWPGDHQKLFSLSTQHWCLGWTWNTGAQFRKHIKNLGRVQ